MENNIFFDENTVVTVAKEVVAAFVAKADEKNIDVDFKMKHGRMEIVQVENKEMQRAITEIHGELTPQPNTSFSFNTEPNTLLFNIKNNFCSQLEKNELGDQEFGSIQNFIKNVINKINNDSNLLSQILQKIRIIHNLTAEHFPMRNSKVVLFEFGHKEDYGDMIKVLNYSRYNKNLQAFVGEKRSVAQDLLLKRREFGYNSTIPTVEIYKKIIDEQKVQKNPIYADLFIEDVKIVREAKECHIDLFVDYSPISQEEFMQMQTTEEFKHGAD